ncbi:unnamed protein product [Closterium sp. Naga37s-1]|nr:unnamed protein product [Closterium sp. Naga37s-1]CAI5509225.1 unnamed protein product [Closterium sp. Naga37s-1]
MQCASHQHPPLPNLLFPPFPCPPCPAILLFPAPRPALSPPQHPYDLFDPVCYASLKGFADDVALLLDELGIQEITFIGHQQAGIVGLLLALQRPDLFHRVITLASSPRLLSDVGYAGGFELQDLDQMWPAGCVLVLTHDDIRLPHVRDFTRPLFSLRPIVAFALLKTTFACDVSAVLLEVRGMDAEGCRGV